MIDQYRTWIFDCDGVLLDSNRVKTQAMFEAAKPHGEDAAMKLVDLSNMLVVFHRFVLGTH